MLDRGEVVPAEETAADARLVGDDDDGNTAGVGPGDDVRNAVGEADVLDLVEMARFLDDDAVTIEEETGPHGTAMTRGDFAPGPVFVKRPRAHGVCRKPR